MTGLIDFLMYVLILNPHEATLKPLSQDDFKNNNLFKSTKATNNPHSILLKSRNAHNAHSSHSIKNE